MNLYWSYLGGGGRVCVRWGMVGGMFGAGRGQFWGMGALLRDCPLHQQIRELGELHRRGGDGRRTPPFRERGTRRGEGRTRRGTGEGGEGGDGERGDRHLRRRKRTG